MPSEAGTRLRAMSWRKRGAIVKASAYVMADATARDRVNLFNYPVDRIIFG